MQADLTGRSIVITGAGRGLGRAYALAVAEAGARVLVNDIDAECAQAVASDVIARGGHAIASSVSVAEPGGGKAIIDECVAAFGLVDGLINNAGLFYTSHPRDDAPEKVRELIGVNVLGALECGLAAIRQMLSGDGGVVINIVSGAALGLPGMGAYGASKGALLAATMSWAMDLEGSNVRVTGMSPIARTRMMDAMAHASTTTQPDDIAPLAVFLLSPSAGRLNGRVVRLVQGKLSLLEPASFRSETESNAKWTAETIGQAVSAWLPDGEAKG